MIAPDDAGAGRGPSKAERRYRASTWGLEAGGYIGTPPMIIDRIGRAVDKGITFFIFFTHDRADPRTLALFAEQVIPAFA